jgi:hypothetical protein
MVFATTILVDIYYNDRNSILVLKSRNKNKINR